MMRSYFIVVVALCGCQQALPPTSKVSEPKAPQPQKNQLGVTEKSRQLDLPIDSSPPPLSNRESSIDIGSTIVISNKMLRQWPKEGRYHPDYTKAVTQILLDREKRLQWDGKVESLTPNEKKKRPQPLCLEDAALLWLYQPSAADRHLVDFVEEEKVFDVIVDLKELKIKTIPFRGRRLGVHLSYRGKTFNYALIFSEGEYEKLLALHKRQDIIIVRGVCRGLWRNNALLDQGEISRYRAGEWYERKPSAPSNDFNPAVSEPNLFSIAFSNCAIVEANRLDLHFDETNFGNSSNWARYMHQEARLLAALARESHKHCASLLMTEIERQWWASEKGIRIRRLNLGATVNLADKDVQLFLPSEVRDLWDDRVQHILRGQYIERKMRLAAEDLKASKAVRWMMEIARPQDDEDNNHLVLSWPRVDLTAPHSGTLRGRNEDGELQVVPASFRVPISDELAKQVVPDSAIPEEISDSPEEIQMYRKRRILENHRSLPVTATIEDAGYRTEAEWGRELFPVGIIGLGTAERLGSFRFLVKLSNLHLAK